MTVQVIGATRLLQVTGTAANDVTQIAFRPGSSSVIEVIENGGAPVGVMLADIDRIQVDSVGGNDRLTVDISGLISPIPSMGLDYNGGSGSNALVVVGSTARTASYNYSAGGADSVQVGLGFLRPTNTSLVSLGPFAEVTANMPAVSTTATVSDALTIAGTADNELLISGSSGSAPLTNLALFQVGRFNLDLGVNDVAAANNDSIVIDPRAAIAPPALPFFLATGDGNDVVNFEGLGGAQFIDAGEGNDSVIGGEGDDTIVGGGGDDVIAGSGGNDLISGALGDDLIFGDAGNDLIFGNDGNDEIGGGEGDDAIVGGIGDDSLTGQGGNDAVFGGDGNDLLFGGLDDDHIFGGEGDDTLVGGDGLGIKPRVNDGADQLFGGNGSDIVAGGTGNDILDGGDDFALDEVIGGGGNDIGYNHLGYKPPLDELRLSPGEDIIREIGGLVDVDAPALNGPFAPGVTATAAALVTFLRSSPSDQNQTPDSVVPFNGPRVGVPPLPYRGLHKANIRVASAAKAKAKANAAKTKVANSNATAKRSPLAAKRGSARQK